MHLVIQRRNTYTYSRTHNGYLVFKRVENKLWFSKENSDAQRHSVQEYINVHVHTMDIWFSKGLETAHGQWRKNMMQKVTQCSSTYMMHIYISTKDIWFPKGSRTVRGSWRIILKMVICAGIHKHTHTRFLVSLKGLKRRLALEREFWKW